MRFCGKTRQGDFKILRQTSRKKFQAKLADLKAKQRRNMHADIRTVGAWLQGVLRGSYQYYAVPGNSARLCQFRDAVQELWLRTLRRRSQLGRRFNWEKFARVCKPWLPPPKILHLYPEERFARQHPR